MLFNRNNDGSQELYELTGLFYASNNFQTIAAEIEAATAVVASNVGHDIIADAEASYAGEAPDMELVNAVRTPIACLAIGNWAKQNLLSHEDTGRKMKVDENERVPFEWMIDRDDRELREKYYRALSALWAYLDAHRDTYGTPLEESESLVQTVDDLEKVVPVERSLYCFHLLLPLFVEVQRTKLEKFADASRMAEIRADRDGNLAWHARRYVILEALCLAVRRWSLTVFPLMVARRFAPSYQGNNEHAKATLQEMEWYLQGLTADAATAKTELQELLSDGVNGWADVKLVPDNDRRNKFFNAG